MQEHVLMFDGITSQNSEANKIIKTFAYDGAKFCFDLSYIMVFLSLKRGILHFRPT